MGEKEPNARKATVMFSGRHSQSGRRKKESGDDALEGGMKEGWKEGWKEATVGN